MCVLHPAAAVESSSHLSTRVWNWCHVHGNGVAAAGSTPGSTWQVFGWRKLALRQKNTATAELWHQQTIGEFWCQVASSPPDRDTSHSCSARWNICLPLSNNRLPSEGMPSICVHHTITTMITILPSIRVYRTINDCRASHIWRLRRTWAAAMARILDIWWKWALLSSQPLCLRRTVWGGASVRISTNPSHLIMCMCVYAVLLPHDVWRSVVRSAV